MSTDLPTMSYHPPILEFKSSTLSVPVLILASTEAKVIEQQLQAKISLAPEFFKNSPLILDLQELNKQNAEINLEELLGVIRGVNLLPVGVRGGTPGQNSQIVALGLPVFSINSSAVSTRSQVQTLMVPPVTPETNEQAEAPATAPSTPTTMIVSQQVRSGQRIYSAGDLVILAPVSAGAEVIAEGNIHVYGTLRGRILAGMQGNTEARIFCSDLQAELISIAGTYKISEDMDAAISGKPVQVYLQNNKLIIKEIL
jgi:septum site-determining protein MinC